MEFAACVVPAAPVRKNPSHKVEMITQLLFGEALRVMKRKNRWFKVQSLHDNYEGWIRSNVITPVEENFVNSPFLAGDLINTIKVKDIKMHIPVGSTLVGLYNNTGEIESFKYEFKGYRINRNEIKPSEKVVRQLTTQWLNAPYLWGGRTPLGVDCSGFVQVIFKIMGVDLLRDSKQQAGQGMNVKKLEDAQCGDLAFFKNKRGKIAHVGILLSSSQIIHASGKVRIDAIDEKGIVNEETGKRTHSFAAIRRYW
jgi:cell wall-associated NlpC family hydrolase